jgi:hypothetical protein
MKNLSFTAVAFSVWLLSIASFIAPCAVAESGASPLPVTRVYTGADGRTRFADEHVALTTIDYAPPSPAVAVSTRFPASDVAFATIPAGYVSDWHSAPRRQYGVLLAGAFEIETGDGEKRTIPSGSILLLEDDSGQGHRTRVVGQEAVVIALIPLAAAGMD